MKIDLAKTYLTGRKNISSEINMIPYHAIRELKNNSTFGKNDVLVIFGELFQKGYANGLVKEAEKRGMKIVRATVGRREKDGSLRPLNSEESSLIPQPFINIPLEAGFDHEMVNGAHIISLLKDVKLTDWKNFQPPSGMIDSAKEQGRKNFRHRVKLFTQELEKHIPPQANVLFAHLMAGGVPRAKIIMPLMNRVFKGVGDRHIPSQEFWDSEIGKLCATSFLEVTAETFQILLEETSLLRDKIKKNNRTAAYLAYGYHGTEVLVDNQFQWQTYTPYVQGWAKMRLENYSYEWSKKGAQTCVYNCPEILTNSSNIFQGVEVSLYPLLAALKKHSSTSSYARDILNSCQAVLKEDFTVDDLIKKSNDYIKSDLTQQFSQIKKWPEHNTKDQMELMLKTSDELYSMLRDSKDELLHILSEVVFQATGRIMLNDIANPEASVSWINHDIISKI